MTLAILAAGLLPGWAWAQSAHKVELTPAVGLYSTFRQAGPGAPVDDLWYLTVGRADPTLQFGLTAQLNWPGTRLATRLSGFFTLPAHAPGTFSCWDGQCPLALFAPWTTDVRVQAAVADLVFSPLVGRARLEPYAVAGAGFKRYHYSWPASATRARNGRHSEITYTLHGGLGLAFNLPGATLHAEITDYWSPVGNNVDLIRVLPAAASIVGRPTRPAQHDISLSIGWRIPVL